MSHSSASALLGRPPLALDPIPEGAFAGNRVLVTGAGGSVGSALCRRLLASDVQSLVLLDHSEGSLHSIVRRLDRRPGADRLRFVLGDAGDVRLLDEVFADSKPHLVFHAAAFKHLPLLESQPLAAFRNNVLATLTLARAAARHDVSRFIHLSTDKAVDPTSVMGASKRMAELALSSVAGGSTQFTSLRLGNVLSSSGSVVPRLRAMVRANRPLTVTHPAARRYFLTRREAVTFLLHAARERTGGDVLVADLPEPVSILDLAQRIRAAMGSDVPIEFTGLQPGEKLEERLHSDDEVLEPTAVQGLFRAVGRRAATADARTWEDDLRIAVERRDVPGLVALLRRVLPDYRPSVCVLESARRAAVLA